MRVERPFNRFHMETYNVKSFMQLKQLTCIVLFEREKNKI